eukprot:3589070-Pyramimonas_sp.AAC.1
MAPRDLRENTSKAVVTLHVPTLPWSRQLAWRSVSGWALGDTFLIATAARNSRAASRVLHTTDDLN